MENQKNNADAGKRKSKFWKFALTFLAIFILIDGGYFVWDRYFSPAARYQRETQKNYEKYLDWQADYEKAMREDTYGGKTPEETLSMFIEALKKEDVELASRYFALNTNENSEYYLTRREWEEGLRKAKEEGGRLEEIIKTIEKMTPSKRDIGSDDSFEYVFLDKNGVVDRSIIFRFNKQSSIWKIESL